MRAITLALAFAPILVHASFDLVIVADRTETNIIEFKRYDGTSGVYLGSFGRHGEYASITALSADPILGVMYSLSSRGIRKWNYSTGEDLGYVNVGASGMIATTDSAGNFIGVVGTNQILKYNLNNTEETIPLPSGVIARWIVQQADGRWYVGDSGAGYLWRSTTTSVSSNYTPFVATAIPAENSKSLYMNYSVAMSSTPHMMIQSRALDAPYYHLLSPSFAYAGTGTFGPASLNRVRDCAPGHNGSGYFMGTLSTTGAASIERWAGDNSWFVVSSASNLVNPLAMTNVMVPEPTTALALLPGLLMIRRNKRAKF